MAIIQPGNSITTATITDGELISTDDSLIDIDGNLIIDTAGNTISIGGGIDGGNDITPVTWE